MQSPGDHEWILERHVDKSIETEFHWKCERCNSRVITAVSSSLGLRAANSMIPLRLAYKAFDVDESCDIQAAKNIMTL